MLTAPEFSSLIVSRPRPAARILLLRLRGLALAATLYVSGLAALIFTPFLLLDVMHPTGAGIIIVDPPIHLDFRQPRGDNRRAGNIRRGARNGRKDGRPATGSKPVSRRPVPRPADAPVPPPESEIAATAVTAAGQGGPGDQSGDPEGTGTGPEGVLDSDCPDCPGTGPEGPGDPDGPYEQWAPGRTPPALIPGTRALPKYPDPARRAGLDGTVILLVVVEADGTVGEIDVIKNPDQRWGFDLAAIDAVKRWRYQPALMSGRPVAAYIQVMVEFTLSR